MTKGNSFHLFGACLLLLCGAHACGGTVVERRSPSPRERLNRDGAATCQSACTAIGACPGKSSCDCGCDCPADTPNCCDSVCMCKPPSVQECVKECQKLVDEEIGKAGCERELLGILDCAASGDCTTNHCSAEARTYTQCRSGADDHTDSTPPSGSATGTCAGGSSIVGTTAGPGAPAEPGALACDTQLSDCADGHEYRLICTVLGGAEISCECSIDGTSSGSFVATSCGIASVQATEFCGWPRR